MKETLRYLIGYLLGFTIFLVAIPYVLYELADLEGLFSGHQLFHAPLVRYLLFYTVLLVGVLFMTWSNLFLSRVGKGGPADGFGIAVSPRTKKLVTSGPYRYSRNPMVFGAFSLYFSEALFQNSVNLLLALLVFLILAICYLKITEERRLLKDFGEEYLVYKQQVPMIFPNLTGK